MREEGTDVAQFVGSIRDRELLERIFRDPDALQADVAEVMAPPIPMVEFDDPIESAFGELEHGPAVLVDQGGAGPGRADQERPAGLPGASATDAADPTVRSLGIDVGVGERVSTSSSWTSDGCRSRFGRTTRPEEVGALIDEFRPDVVAIDSPPSLGGRRTIPPHRA